MDPTILYKLSYGLYVVGAFKEGRPVGCVVNTCFQVTAEPPVLAVSLNKCNYTLEAIRENKRFSVSILAEDSDPAVIGKFGFFSSRDTDKYADFGFEVKDFVPYVKGRFAGRLILEAERFVDCGTHVVVLARLIDTVEGSGTPMTYAYYHNVIKGKAPKSAPTYRADEDAPQPSGKRRYECDICHYIVEVDGELPDDFVCPVCGVDRSHFKELV
ncbi:MAG: flavin reductase [Muribaculaceae bacterium]|nr:flavin reductase [Muribaculaceae bacterium]MDE7142577.1 flavin reductase [Muribaculaceae bacterium]